MAQCKQCGNKGLFLRVNAHGFCEKCNNSLKQKELEKAKEQERFEKERKNFSEEDINIYKEEEKSKSDSFSDYN